MYLSCRKISQINYEITLKNFFAREKFLLKKKTREYVLRLSEDERAPITMQTFCLVHASECQHDLFAVRFLFRRTSDGQVAVGTIGRVQIPCPPIRPPIISTAFFIAHSVRAVIYAALDGRGGCSAHVEFTRSARFVFFF